MKRQKRKMFFKELLHDSKIDARQFKTVSGSPILYTKLKRHKGIYYPLAKHREHSTAKVGKSHKHACVVLSKSYGREVYTNIDIWPDETARERLIQKLKGLSFSECEEDNNADIGIDIPTEIIVSEHENGAEDTLNVKSLDDKKHVTDAEKESDSSYVDERIHPDPYQVGPYSNEEGLWPLKRSQSINSRDNPFLPGGNLSKEADEILSKATIIRDTFILTDEQNKASKQNSPNTTQSPVNQSPVQESVTHHVLNSECVPDQSESPARTRLKENGQLDTDNSFTPAAELTDDNKDRKKQKKCCAIM